MEDTAELLEKKLASEISKMSLEEALTLAPVFSHYLNLMGIAELLQRGVSPDQLYDTVCKQEVEIVLTAHPTQINRGTLRYKYIRLSHLLNLRDRPDLTSEDRDMVIEDLMSLGTINPHQLMKLGFEHCGAVPLESCTSLFMSSQQCFKEAHWETGKPLPLKCTPIRFGSWMGGGRDGNSNVTAKVTKDVSLLSRWMTIDLYIREVDSLKFELSMNWCSNSLSKLAQEILEHKSASEDHQSWDHQCYNRNQESGRHAETLDAITKYLDMGTYSEWDEEKKLEFLTREFKGKRPLVPSSMEVK
ncbi:phosphoenolpyruvate carboxylase 4 [Rosa chinensis]|uniref:phosphoenolpyruvate carboxylase 4 n=1 Tax=Rosa chinensis TaxID=74649 RepID=UPI000D09234C|nr:phosphoenolpyruvate carboxylase 4 [Rosa chinensis]